LIEHFRTHRRLHLLRDQFKHLKLTNLDFIRKIKAPPWWLSMGQQIARLERRAVLALPRQASVDASQCDSACGRLEEHNQSWLAAMLDVFYLRAFRDGLARAEAKAGAVDLLGAEKGRIPQNYLQLLAGWTDGDSSEQVSPDLHIDSGRRRRREGLLEFSGTGKDSELPGGV
jgi:hypothetical protein